jgi:hypothetical protein
MASWTIALDKGSATMEVKTPTPGRLRFFEFVTFGEKVPAGSGREPEQAQSLGRWRSPG